MSSILTGLQNLISSVFEIFSGIFTAILSGLESVFALFQNLIGSIFDLMSGLVGFILGNIIIIGVLIGAYVGYSAYRQKHQGGGITAGKKRS